VAVRFHAEARLQAALAREYRDLDLVTSRAAARGMTRFFQEAGYEPHVAFNTLNGRDHLLFFDPEHGRRVDVFVGSFRMCHEIPLEGRLHADDPTIPLAELFLTKLQIVQLNAKDVTDTLALVHGHEVGDDDVDRVNAAGGGAVRGRLGPMADDHGEPGGVPDARRLLRPAGGGDRGGDGAARRAPAPDRNRAEVASWRLRARVGERKRWYELPEEVGSGP
jgi:hypothetical protein